MELLEDKMEKCRRQNIETRFASYEDRILGSLSISLNKSSFSTTVSSNTSGVSSTQVPIQPTNYCTEGASSVANNILRWYWIIMRSFLDKQTVHV